MEKVILVHGFFRTQSDMYPLRDFLRNCGYDARTVTLPTTFRSLEVCCKKFKQAVDRLMEHPGPLHLVGHSMGGLVVRVYAAERGSGAEQGRCVLIGPPNKGSMLAEQVATVLGPLGRVIGGLQSLRPETIRGSRLLSGGATACGIIAGTDHRLLRGALLPRENDGMVTVDETKMENMADFITLPYVHTKIHRVKETACLVDRFLRTGTFKKEDTQRGPCF